MDSSLVDVKINFIFNFIRVQRHDVTAAKWKTSKKMLKPAFNVQLLIEHVKSFAGPCEELLRQLKGEVGNDGFDAFAYTYLCGLDIICGNKWLHK